MLTYEERSKLFTIAEPINGDLTGKAVLSVEQFSRSDLDRFFEEADWMKRIKEQNGSTDILRGKILVNLFYEASTRTDSSFSIAMKRLGGEVHNIVGVQFSSVSKGETLSDTVRVLSGYADLIVLRHHQKGAAAEAALAIHKERTKQGLPNIPLINAGDGVGEHPSQALLDTYTINQKCGGLDDLTVGLVGDLKHGRTVHSLAKLLSLYRNVKLIFVSPESLNMPEELVEELKAKGVQMSVAKDINEVANEADVWYITRVQKERFESEEAYQAVSGSYRVTLDTVASMKPTAIIMHPLPRVGEIDEAVDELPQAVYFEQASNGMYVRMALLSGVLGKW
ncbi:MAG: aspartate carbamoyltransferase [Chloroflexi bacterium]|uniref:Aspartate carbamoyltransferase n=1 Tax=Candidatus Chlorohelix allophototropha TaxID=3003348 RepID=A0A8T7M878_9CHLR|nr:aspartate carbamoyltransferase [Chloroflexota bacterium]WJW68292.1 aspartate carbamoyltransferase [Chloroflexota bacterium L227-S17]